ncbi:shikimate kinase [Tenacibaculum jejuense]|uniref:Shikimate kinase n=1 Tax=Tenacibaculum jejuense TaxID=584609 RepID=A0A238UBD9_9FLAO|nr:shikimate kinase [Tenacibaculum jejuense]SNR15730.1 Shikimate kinase [Tenacibaculum jejuense]
MKIILLGYMGSGKSTIGKSISEHENLPFIDLDHYIESKLNKSISEIFDLEGEIFFRLKEHEYLKELLNREDDFILSLGGGTPCYAGNMDVINSMGVNSIYLRTSIQTIVGRLKDEKESRPLVAKLNDEELHEFIAKHLFERSFFYEQALHKVNTSDKNVDEIISDIKAILKKQ